MLNFIPLLNSHYSWASSRIAPSIHHHIFLSWFQPWLLPSPSLHSYCIKHPAVILIGPCGFTPPCLCGGLDNHTACVLMPTSIIAATTLITCTYMCPTLVACSLQQTVWQTPNLKTNFHASLSRPFLPFEIKSHNLRLNYYHYHNIGQLKWLISTSPYNHLLHF